jgi:hypothetical protein
MNHNKIIQELTRNKLVFNELLTGLTDEEFLWKQNPEKWCLLEIICHLYDEEREDFRTRTKQVLESPELLLPKIDPVGWVIERKYLQQNFSEKLKDFLSEREQSVKWLQSLKNPKWENAYNHPKLGKMTAKLILANWLAHDYLHIRQITKLKYDHLKSKSDADLSYAGNW